MAGPDYSVTDSVAKTICEYRAGRSLLSDKELLEAFVFLGIHTSFLKALGDRYDLVYRDLFSIYVKFDEYIEFRKREKIWNPKNE